VLIAVGLENAFPWIEPECGVEFRDGLPKLDPKTFQSTHPRVFFGGDSAFGPKNIITAVAHGHDAAISIDAFCRGASLSDRPPPMVNLVSQKMGIHEWSYDNAVANDLRYKVPTTENAIALKSLRTEVELGFDLKLAFAEAQRCLNCDVETVFNAPTCIECDACVDICPIDCISFVPDGSEDDVSASLNAPRLHEEQAIYVAGPLKTGRIMVKDEDLCLHCGLCAERCPTGAWDMQRFTINIAQAEHVCRSRP
jgi:ferredoxin